MKKLARHKWLIVGITAGVTLVGTVYLRYSATGSALALQAPEPYDLTTPWERGQVDGLLNHLSLDHEALVALNLTALQAEDVLDTVRTWRLTNQATLAARKTDIDNAVHARRQIEKTIALGPADAQNDQTLAQDRQDLVDAHAAYDTALNSLRTDVNTILSASQEDTWTAIQSGHGQSMPIRMLDLSDQQRVDIGKAWQRYRLQHRAAQNATERAAAVTTWESAQARIFSAGQQTVVAGFHSNYVAASQNVTDAFETVLPRDDGAG